MLMKNRCKTLFCLKQPFYITLKARQYLLLKVLMQRQVKVKFVFWKHQFFRKIILMEDFILAILPEKCLLITPSQYIHDSLKCFDNRFLKNEINIFRTLDWDERVAISNSISFFEKKPFQEDFTAGAINSRTSLNMLSDDIMKASFQDTTNPSQLFFEKRKFYNQDNPWQNNIIYH